MTPNPFGGFRWRVGRAGMVLFLTLAVSGPACLRGGSEEPGSPGSRSRKDPFRSLREKMVEVQIRARGVENPRVLQAMETVPRHLFVPSPLRGLAHEDHPLRIGFGQTISQPYIVALMTESLQPKRTDRVLEIGTGSGYQAAILSRLVREVYTIEIVEELARSSRILLEGLGYGNVRFRHGDGYRGWPEAAPFDRIMVTAAPDHVPPALVEQLRPGGRMVIPVGERVQELRLIVKTKSGTRETTILPVRFVPMTGEARKGRPSGNPRP